MDGSQGIVAAGLTQFQAFSADEVTSPELPNCRRKHTTFATSPLYGLEHSHYSSVV